MGIGFRSLGFCICRVRGLAFRGCRRETEIAGRREEPAGQSFQGDWTLTRLSPSRRIP